MMSVLLFVVILIFSTINNENVISAIFKLAGYTYGPLLGLYAFGLFTSYAIRDRYVWIPTLLSPIFCYLLNLNSEQWLNGYKFGFELLILNGFFTFMGLFLIRDVKIKKQAS